MSEAKCPRCNVHQLPYSWVHMKAAIHFFGSSICGESDFQLIVCPDKELKTLRMKIPMLFNAHQSQELTTAEIIHSELCGCGIFTWLKTNDKGELKHFFYDVPLEFSQKNLGADDVEKILLETDWSNLRSI